MAYFSNGSEGDYYIEKYCLRCKNWRQREGEETEGCPIMDAHLIMNYDQCENEGVKEILEFLWPTNKDHFPGKCRMFGWNGECEGQMVFEESSIRNE